MNKCLFNVLMIIFCTLCSGQLNQDARMLALNGAYSTIARGYQCVGINPANLAYSPAFTMNFFTLNMGLGNNALSLNRVNDLNGADLEDSSAETYYPKDDLDYIFTGDGLRFTTDFVIPLPLLNLSLGRFAFTSTEKVFVDFGLPQGFIDLLFFGNEIGRDLSIEIPLEMMAAQEAGFSYATTQSDFTLGITAKYILGFFYTGMEAIDSSYFRTDSTSFTGQGSFLAKQAIGGNGFGLDLGVLTKENADGWQMGASVTNLFASIKWTQDHFLRTALDETIKGIVGEEYFLRQNERYYYHLEIDSLNAVNLSSKPMEEMISRNGYPVIEISSLSQLPNDAVYVDSLVVMISDNSGYLIPSSELTDSVLLSLTSKPFTTNYPSIFRFGLSKRYDESVIVNVDMSTGFSDELGGYDSWRLAFGAEITHYPMVDIRTGLAIGGSHKRSISMGVGFHIGSIQFDLGLAYRNGYSINSLKGIDFSFTSCWR